MGFSRVPCAGAEYGPLPKAAPGAPTGVVLATDANLENGLAGGGPNHQGYWICSLSNNGGECCSTSHTSGCSTACLANLNAGDAGTGTTSLSPVNKIGKAPKAASGNCKIEGGGASACSNGGGWEPGLAVINWNVCRNNPNYKTVYLVPVEIEGGAYQPGGFPAKSGSGDFGFWPNPGTD